MMAIGARAGQMTANARRHLIKVGRDVNHSLGLSKIRARRDETVGANLARLMALSSKLGIRLLFDRVFQSSARTPGDSARNCHHRH